MNRTLITMIGRPTNATDSVSLVREWLYNRRSELVEATVGTDRYGYAYDTIGNRLWSSENAATTTYAANNLNQYTSVSSGAKALVMVLACKSTFKRSFAQVLTCQRVGLHHLVVHGTCGGQQLILEEEVQGHGLICKTD